MTPSAKAALKALGAFLFWTALFSLAYTQSPLYTSNQNQYFLHGLTRAGYGTLSGDWLANTLDPTPVFSALVEILYCLFRQPAVFYLLYGLLMGVYLFSALGIARELFHPQIRPVPRTISTAASGDQDGKRVWGNSFSLEPAVLLFLGLFITLHSAGLRFFLSRLLSPNWTYVLEDGVADQRLLGPVLQPSAFGVFLVLSVFLFLRRRPVLAVFSAALAAVVHPTYLLSAAFLTLAYMAALVVEEHSARKAAVTGLAALLAVAPIVVYVFNSFSGAGSDPTLAAEARRLLVHVRIPHHALVAWWFDATAVAKVLLIVTALFLARRSRLFLPLLIPFLCGLALTLVQVLSNSDFLALLFPWRVSVLLVPLAAVVILSWSACRLVAQPALQAPRSRLLLCLAPAALIGFACLAGLVRFGLDLQRKGAAPERFVQAFVYSEAAPGKLYLTPVKMQDFRLAAGAPVFVDFKSIPYQAGDVLEWERRYRLADSFYHNPTCPALEQLADNEGISRLVLPAGEPLNCPSLRLLYSDAEYSLFALE